ncbi:MAG: hypothetical protein F4X66_08985 [Chloroflexi bacterium]|nr:hypothetical protein [Chloroflexota bacterium]
MPDNRPEKEPSQEEPGTAIPPELTDEQAQDAPRGHDGKTFMEHARESMEEHETLGRLLL